MAVWRKPDNQYISSYSEDKCMLLLLNAECKAIAEAVNANVIVIGLNETRSDLNRPWPEKYLLLKWKCIKWHKKRQILKKLNIDRADNLGRHVNCFLFAKCLSTQFVVLLFLSFINLQNSVKHDIQNLRFVLSSWLPIFVWALSYIRLMMFCFV